MFRHKLVNKYVDKIEEQFLANSFMINKIFIIKNIVQKKFLSYQRTKILRGLDEETRLQKLDIRGKCNLKRENTT